MSIISQILDCINNNDIENAYKLIIDNEGYYKDNAEFWMLKANLCIKAEIYSTAYSCLSTAMKLEPYNSDIFYNMAYVCECMRMYSEAALLYGKAAKYTDDVQLKQEIDNIYPENQAFSYIKNIAMTNKNRKYIILSSCGWGDVLQRMHHIARALVKFENDVLYISPTLNANVDNANVSMQNSLDYIITQKRVIDKVNVYQPLNVMYNRKFLFNNYCEIVQYLLDTECKNCDTVIIAYLPSQVQTLKRLKGKYKIIYECVDDHSDLEYAFWGNKKDIVWEQELMDMSDAITTTATSLFLQRMAIEGRKDVYLSRNAVNEVDFVLDDIGIPEDLRNIPEPRIVYTGAIYQWFDVNLFYDVVQSNPDKSFVIIGFGQNDLLKKKYDNLYFLGVKKHSELNRYLKHMQIGIIPFKDDADIIINCDPIKQYEYLACGLPVITTFMPESAINKINTFTANTKEEINKAIEACLGVNADKTSIAEFLVENSWNARAALLCSIIENAVDAHNISGTLSILEKKLLELGESSHPNYLILYSMLLNMKDKQMFLEFAEKAFMKSKTRYIERQYLYALFINKRFEDFIVTAEESVHIEPYLLAELIYRKNMNDTKGLEIMMLYCIKNYKKAKGLSDKLVVSEDQMLFVGLYYFLLGEIQKAQDYINNILPQRRLNSPTYEHLISYLVKTRVENASSFHSDLKRSYSIAVLIFTRNRTHLLERCVNYFQNMSDERINVNIFVLDASDMEIKQKNKELLKKYDEKRVKYWEFAENSLLCFRIISVIPYIKDEFCCCCADDDFMHKEGIIKSIEILKANKEVVTVKGKSYVFFNNDIDKIYYFPRDACDNLIESNPIDRLEKLVQKWVPQLNYSVFRKNEQFLLMTNLLKGDSIKDIAPVFFEYLWYFYVPLCGNIININEPLNIRDLNPKSSSYTTPGFYTYIQDGSFNKHYALLKKCLIDFSKNSKQVKVELSKRLDGLMRKFLITSWQIPSDCVEIINDGEFNIDLLRKGMQIAQGK